MGNNKGLRMRGKEVPGIALSPLMKRLSPGAWLCLRCMPDVAFGGCFLMVATSLLLH